MIIKLIAKLIADAIGIYLALGVLMTVILAQTPYADNGWINTTLLWPFYAAAFFFR